MKVGSILDLHSLKSFFNKSPEFSLDYILRNFAVRVPLLLEPLLLEGVAFLLEGAQRVLLTFLETKILASDETLWAVPVRLGDVLERRIEAEGVMAKLAAIADQHPIQVSAFVAKFANSFGISFNVGSSSRCSLGRRWIRRETVRLRCSWR